MYGEGGQDVIHFDCCEAENVAGNERVEFGAKFEPFVLAFDAGGGLTRSAWCDPAFGGHGSSR